MLRNSSVFCSKIERGVCCVSWNIFFFWLDLHSCICFLQDSDNPEDCKVCFNTFNEADRRPRNLPCGHAYCSLCIGDMIKDACLSCPSCRTDHEATDANQFPVAYMLEEVVKKLSGIQITPTAPTCEEENTVASLSTRPRQISRPRGISRKLQSLVDEQNNSVVSLSSTCQDLISQLRQYRQQLEDWRAQHFQLIEGLSTLLGQNRSMIHDLEREMLTVGETMSEGEERHEQLESVHQSLNAIDNAQEAVKSIGAADQANEEADDWAQRVQELFPKSIIVHNSFKVRLDFWLVLWKILILTKDNK